MKIYVHKLCIYQNNPYLCIVNDREDKQDTRSDTNKLNHLNNLKMSNYQFITAKNEENRRGIVYLAISQEIETLAMSDTYSNYGQQVSPGDAGDYCELLTENAVKLANEYNEENDDETRYVIGDIINAYNNSYLYDHLSENCSEGDLEFQKSGLKG